MSKLAVGIAVSVPKLVRSAASTIGPPVNTAVPIVIGEPVVGFALTASTGDWDGQIPMTAQYQWKVDGLDVGIDSFQYMPVTGDVGKPATVTVSMTNISGGPVAATSLPTSVIKAQTAPTNTSAPIVHNVDGNTVSPVKAGTRLDVVSVGAWNGAPSQASMTFSTQWRRNGVNIDGANGDFYITRLVDVNQNIDCRITASNGVVPGGSANSNFFQVYSLPVNTVAPLITGSGNDDTATVGEILNCTSGTWAGLGSNFAYQWRRNGTINIGSNSNTYVIQSDDAGATVDCIVTKSNEYGSTSEPSSNQYTIA